MEQSVMSQIDEVVMPEMIPVTRQPHPLGVQFLAYYGNSKLCWRFMILDINLADKQV